MAGGPVTPDAFAFQGRTAGEYERFFDLTPGDWNSILDCGAGPSSFTATVHATTDVVAADPAYRAPMSVLRDRSESSVERLASTLPDLRERFVWTFYEEPAERIAFLERAHEEFFADVSASPGRYVAAALPRLPFRDDSFELVLAAHLLFMYDHEFDEAFHRRAIAELCRVASREVRVYPLASLDGQPSEQVGPVTAELEAAGHEAERQSVPFEFQQGANEMLVVTPA